MSKRYSIVSTKSTILDEEFQDIGMQTGLEYIDLSGPQPVVFNQTQKENPVLQGKFISNCCYLFIHTVRKDLSNDYTNDLFRGGSPLKWSIYIWKGKDASLIQFGTAGTRATQLKDKLTSNTNFHDALVHKINQGQEPEVFKKLFKSPLTVSAPTASESPLESSFVPKLYRVGRKLLQRLPLSMDIEAGAYVLDTFERVWSFSKDSTRIEQAYAEEFSRRRCKADYRGRLRPIPLTSKSNPKVLKTFFDFLASHEQDFDSSNDNENVTLSKFIDGQFEPAEQSTLSTELLDSEVLQRGQIFLLTCQGESFLWLGKGVSLPLQLKAKLLAKEKLAPGTELMTERQNMESVYFKERFFGFDQTDMLEIANPSLQTESEFKLSVKHATTSKERRVSGEWTRVLDLATQVEVIDLPPGNLVGFRHTGSRSEELKPWELGVFDSKSVYTYVLSVKNGTLHYVWTWIGRHAGVRERAVAGIHTAGNHTQQGMSVALMGTKVFKQLDEGNEPVEFVSLLQHYILIKGIGTLENNQRIVCLEVFGNKAIEVKLEDLRETGLVSFKQYIFIVGSPSIQKITSLNPEPARIFHIGDPSLSYNPHLPKIFNFQDFAIACSDPSPASDLSLNIPSHNVSKTEINGLYHVSESLRKTGGMFIHQIHDFSQADLESNSIYILDKDQPLFLWVGSKTSNEAVELGIEAVTRFLVRHRKDRPGKIEVVEEGKEPPLFTSSFVGWQVIRPDETKEDLKAKQKITMATLGRSLSVLRRDTKQEDKQTTYRQKIAKYTELANAPDKARYQNEKRQSMKIRDKKMNDFKQRQSLRRSRMRSVRKSKLVTFRPGSSMSNMSLSLPVQDRLKDRLSVVDGHLNVLDVDKPLCILQHNVTLTTILNGMRVHGKTNVALFKYVSETSVEFVSNGNGGLRQMVETIGSVVESVRKKKLSTGSSNVSDTKTGGLLDTLKEATGIVFYGVLRIEKEKLQTVLSKADKYVLVTVMPQNTRPALRAAASVHRPAVKDIMGPFDADVLVSDVEELTEANLIQLVSF